MKLTRGEHTDSLLVNQPEETWRSARNLVWDRDSLRVEEGFAPYITTISGDNYTVIGELLLPDESLMLFVISNTSSNIIIKPKEDFNTTYAISTLPFLFDEAYPIRAKAKYTNDLNIEVVFTDNLNPPRKITIDTSTIPYVMVEDSIDKTNLFPDIEIPNFDLISVDSGGLLEKGSYYVTLAYNFGDDAYTNWVGMSNQIILTSNGQGFTLQLNDLDTKFESFKVGLIKVSEQNVITTYETTLDYNISASTKIITIIGSTTSIALADIIVKSVSYDRIGDLAVVDGRLYAANLYRDAQLDYQTYANAIRIEPVYEDLVALDSEEGSYADPIIAFDKVGFQDDEIYAFYIRLWLKDGTPGGDFFIPSQGYNAMDISTNSNEEYPLNKNYPSGNVRHHLFPKKAAADFLSGSDGSGTASDAIRENGVASLHEFTVDQFYGIKYAAAGSGALGTVINDPATTYSALTYNTIQFSDTLDLTLVIDFDMSATIALNDGGIIQLEVSKNVTAGNSFTFIAAQGVTAGPAAGTYTLSGNITVDVSVVAGDTITFRGYFNGQGFSGNIDTNQLSWKAYIKNVIPSADANFFTKPTGIKVTNVVIPTEIASKIQGYEILYASRNGSNSRVLGQSIAYPDNWRVDDALIADGKVRFHAFDILLDKPSIYPNKLRGQYTIDETDNVSNAKYVYLGNTITANTFEDDIYRGKYIPNNNLAASNEDGEEHYSFLLSTGTSITNRLIANLINSKTDYYLGLESQILQSTGVVHKVTSSGTYSVDKLYGGDCYTCLYDVRLTKKRPEAVTSDYYIRNTKIPVQSKHNIAIREWGSDWWEVPELLFPPSSEYIALGLDNDTLNTAGYTTNEQRQAVRADYTKRYTNYFEYDKGYSFGNKFIQAEIQGDTISNYPFRIIRSPKQDLESQISSWRIFLPNDYYEQNKERGVINNLAVIDTDKLIIHHTNGLFITNAKEKLASSATEIIIGSGDIFDRKPKEAIYTTHGTLGSKHKFANFTCEMGYIFISRGRIYSLSGELKDLTPGNSRFFFDNLDTGDNPYLQNKASQYYVGGISMAYDREYDRLLIAVNRASSSYTKSYSKVNGWTANHDYVDCKLFNTNEKPYSLNYNSTLGKSKLYEHNAGNRATYYDGVVYDSSISIVANAQPDLDKMFHNVSWKLTDLAINKNFKTIKVTTDTNDTGEITLIPFTDIFTEYNVRKMLSTWYFNKLSVNGGSLGTAYPISGLYGLIELKLDNTDQEDAAIIDIDYDYQIIDPQ